MHLVAVPLEHPERFDPAFRVNAGSKPPWRQIGNDLQGYQGTLLYISED